MSNDSKGNSNGNSTAKLPLPLEPKWPPMTLREWYRYHRSEGFGVAASAFYGMLDYLVN